VPLVLLHGTGSSLHSWQGWADRLKATRRIIRIDRPGFGLTGPNPTNDYSMRSYSAFLVRLLDRLEVRRAVVVGNSSGGRMAWEFAVAHPERVEALVLLAPAGYPRSTPMPMGLRIAMSPWAGPLLEHILPRSQVRQGLRSSFGDPTKVTDEMVDRSYDLTLRAGNRRALGETLRQAQATDNSAAITKVRVPTLILWGTRDRVIPPDPDASRYARDIRGAALVMLPGLGHLPHEENPDATVAALNGFLARQSDVSRRTLVPPAPVKTSARSAPALMSVNKGL
jgi:pimeloyl-ACP methyl ester carboxylesterase